MRGVSLADTHLLYKQSAQAPRARAPGKTPKVSPAAKQAGADVPSRSEAAPTLFPRGATDALKARRQPGTGAPLGEREQASPRAAARGGQGGTGRAPPDEARAQAEASEDAPQRAEARGEEGGGGAQGRGAERSARAL